MENEVHSTRAGIVSGLSVSAGEPVTTGQVICAVVPAAVDSDNHSHSH
jgi:biotin carboxyl carrier protein